MRSLRRFEQLHRGRRQWHDPCYHQWRNYLGLRAFPHNSNAAGRELSDLSQLRRRGRPGHNPDHDQWLRQLDQPGLGHENVIVRRLLRRGSRSCRRSQHDPVVQRWRRHLVATAGSAAIRKSQRRQLSVHHQFPVDVCFAESSGAGQVFQSNDTGFTWSNTLFTPSNGPLGAISCSSLNDCVAVANDSFSARDSVVFTTNGGSAWSPVTVDHSLT